MCALQSISSSVDVFLRDGPSAVLLFHSFRAPNIAFRWINGKTGRRSDVPHHFIYNQSDNKNLQVVTGAKVKRVIFEYASLNFTSVWLNVTCRRGDRAVGVEYVTDTTIRPDADQTIKIARSARIVVSAGAFGSPAILERYDIYAS